MAFHTSGYSIPTFPSTTTMKSVHSYTLLACVHVCSLSFHQINAWHLMKPEPTLKANSMATPLYHTQINTFSLFFLKPHIHHCWISLGALSPPPPPPKKKTHTHTHTTTTTHTSPPPPKKKKKHTHTHTTTTHTQTILSSINCPMKERTLFITI